MEYLSKVGLADWAHHLPNQMSGGQQQRIAVARALYRLPRVLILDEATAALDSAAERRVLEAIRRRRAEGCTIVVIAHRPSTIAVADDLVVLERGRIRWRGRYDEAVASGVLAAAKTEPTVLGERAGGVRETAA